MRATTKWLAALAAAGMIGAGVAGCGSLTDGVIQAAPAFFITTQQEVAIGVQGAQEVVSQTPIATDAKLQAYVTQIGNAAVTKADRPELPWRFTVLQDDAPDAFALPGGFVFVTTGIIRRMKDEAELSGVLSHEVGHIAARHSVDMIRQAALAQGVQTAVLGQSGPATQVVANVVTTLVLRGYGREKELEADKLGVTYTTLNGYDPTALGDMLKTLENEGGSTPTWLQPLSSHPTLAERLSGIDAAIVSLGGGGGTGKRGSRGDASRFAAATASVR